MKLVKESKITVRVSDEGHILLEDIFPKDSLTVIEFYKVIRQPDGTIILSFYDKNNKRLSMDNFL